MKLPSLGISCTTTCRLPQTLRVTPAMEASITKHVWTVTEKWLAFSNPRCNKQRKAFTPWNYPGILHTQILAAAFFRSCNGRHADRTYLVP